MSGSVGNVHIERGNPGRMRLLIGISYFVCSVTRVYTTSGLTAAILCPMSASVGDESIKTDDHQNMGLLFGISIPAVLERDLQVFPVK